MRIKWLQKADGQGKGSSGDSKIGRVEGTPKKPKQNASTKCKSQTESVLHNYTFISMQQGEPTAKLPLSLCHSLSTPPTPYSNSPQSQRQQLPNPPTDFCSISSVLLFCHVSVCVYVPRLLDANRCQGYSIPLQLICSTHLTHTPFLHSLSHLYRIIRSWSHCPRWLPLHCMAFTSFRDT